MKRGTGLLHFAGYNRLVPTADLDEIARRHHMSLVVRFGSTVTGHVHPGSDVDLAILFEHFPVGLDAELSAIADLQSVGHGRSVDVTVLNRADPLLLKQVSEHAVLEYGTDRQFDAFRRYAFKRYQDHRPFLDMERDYVERALAAKSHDDRRRTRDPQAAAHHSRHAATRRHSSRG